LDHHNLHAEELTAVRIVGYFASLDGNPPNKKYTSHGAVEQENLNTKLPKPKALDICWHSNFLATQN
jgi:hypothetical protein